MADLQKLPIGIDVIGSGIVVVSPTIEERPATQYNPTPYRVFSLSGDKQQEVAVRVDGLENSDIPSGMMKVKEVTGLTLAVRNIRQRNKTKAEVFMTAKSIRFERM